MTQLIVLGTGNAVAVHCYNTCSILSFDEGLFMVDGGGGNGIFNQLQGADVALSSIRHLFVTHAHTDHLLGVVWLVRMIGQSLTAAPGTLTLYGHHEVLEALETICRLTLKSSVLALFGETIRFLVVEDGEQKSILGQEFTFFDTGSTKMRQFGFALTDSSGLRYTCLGDEPFHQRNRHWVEGVDWLAAEAFCLHGEREIFKPYEKSHSTVRDVARQAEELEVKNLLLWHTEESHCPEGRGGERSRLYTEEAEKEFRGRVLVPEDLDVISLRKP